MSQSASLSLSSKKAKSLTSKRQAPSPGVVLDGIIYNPSSDKLAAQDTNTPPQAAQDIHSRTSRSMALMREAVSLPKRAPQIKSDIKRTSKTVSHIGSRFSFKLKADPTKSERAKTVERSNKISRFGGSTEMPKPDLGQNVTKISAKVRAVAHAPNQVAAASSAASTSLALSHPVPAMPKISNQKLEAMLDRALQQADAHKQMLSGKLNRSFWQRMGKSKLILLTVGMLLALAAILFVAYLKVPSISVKVASLASGVDARAPSYVPPGFSLSKTSFDSGDVTMTYKNGNQTFSINQQKSGLNEEGLRSSVVAPTSKLYQASQYNGVTVYTYGNKASWVNQGIKTTITANSALDNDQKSKLIEGSLSQ